MREAEMKDINDGYTEAPCGEQQGQVDYLESRYDGYPSEDQVIDWNEANDYVDEGYDGE